MKDKNKLLLVNALIFLFFIVFFTTIMPLVPFDGDDWNFTGIMRVLPIPIWGVWNPTRVLPEVLSPLLGYIAAFVVYPLIGNYVFAISLVRAICVAFFCTLFLYFFFKMVRQRLSLSFNRALVGELFLFISCFLFCKHIDQPSYSAFWTMDFDCTLFYLVPGLLNGILLFYMLRTSKFVNYFSNISDFKKGIFWVSLYFAIFSSSQFNIILAIFSIWQIVKEFNTHNSVFEQTFRQSYIYVAILFGWIITIIFDIKGGRSASLSGAMTIKQLLTSTLHDLSIFWAEMNHNYVALAVIIVITTLWAVFHTNNSNGYQFSDLVIFSVFGFCVSFAYLIFAYLKAGSFYITRIDAMWPSIFFFNLSFCISLLFWVDNFSLVRVVSPLILVCGSFIAFNFNYQPIQANLGNHDARSIYTLDNYIINRITQADRNGKKTLTVAVPYNGKNSPKIGTSNWPHSYDMANELSNTLYIHHMTQKKMKVKFKPDRRINKQFYDRY